MSFFRLSRASKSLTRDHLVSDRPLFSKIARKAFRSSRKTKKGHQIAKSFFRGTQRIIPVEYLFGKMSSRAFLINAFCFRRDNNDVLGTKIGQLGFSPEKAIRPKVFG